MALSVHESAIDVLVVVPVVKAVGAGGPERTSAPVNHALLPAVPVARTR